MPSDEASWVLSGVPPGRVRHIAIHYTLTLNLSPFYHKRFLAAFVPSSGAPLGWVGNIVSFHAHKTHLGLTGH